MFSPAVERLRGIPVASKPVRRPHVYQRSAPRQGSEHKGPANSRSATLRMLAAQLATMADRADAVGEHALGDMLDAAMNETERLLAEAAFNREP